MCCAVASAQPISRTISDGPTTFTLGDNVGAPGTPAPAGPAASFSLGGPSHIAGTWWWIRIDETDTRERSLYRPTAAITEPSANVLRLVYAYPCEFDATANFIVTNFGPNFGSLNQSLQIRNRSGLRRTVNIFQFTRLALMATPGNDVPSYAGNNIEIRDTQTSGLVATYEGGSAIYVTPSATIVGLLNDPAATDFPVDIDPPGPGELGVLARFTFALSSSGIQTVNTFVTLNGQPVPRANCLADVASDSLDTQRNPNGQIGAEDLDAFIAGFISGNGYIADIASDGLDTAYSPNGQVGSEDLDAFIASFVAGC